MKAIKYKIEVCDGGLDLAHGFTYSIEEIFIPELKLCINYTKEKINCFRAERSRSLKEAEQIEILDSFAKRLEILIVAKEECAEGIKKVLGEKNA